MKKKVLSVLVILLLVVVVLIFFTYRKLASNKTFFKTTYIGYDYKERFIPKYSYFENESGYTCASFKSLRSKKELEKEIDEYLKDFEYFNDFEEDTSTKEYGLTYGYRKGDLFIQSYDVIDEGLFRRIYLVY